MQPFGHNKDGPKIGGSAPFWGGGSVFPSSTMWTGPRPTFMPSAILIHPAVCTIDMGRKLGASTRAPPPFWEGGCMGPHLTQSPWAEAYLHTKWHLDSSSRLATIEMGRKLGTGAPLFFGGGELGPRLAHCSLDQAWPASVPSAILIHPAVWVQWTWAENWGRGLCPLGGGAGSPSNSVASAEACLHAKFHLDLSSRFTTIQGGPKNGATLIFLNSSVKN